MKAGLLSLLRKGGFFDYNLGDSVGTNLKMRSLIVVDSNVITYNEASFSETKTKNRTHTEHVRALSAVEISKIAAISGTVIGDACACRRLSRFAQSTSLRSIDDGRLGKFVIGERIRDTVHVSRKTVKLHHVLTEQDS